MSSKNKPATIHEKKKQEKRVNEQKLKNNSKFKGWLEVMER